MVYDRAVLCHLRDRRNHDTVLRDFSFLWPIWTIQYHGVMYSRDRRIDDHNSIRRLNAVCILNFAGIWEMSVELPVFLRVRER